MTKKQCDVCLFAGQCRAQRQCSMYAPTTLDEEDKAFEKMHEREKKKYYKEWIEYISDF